ncbi:MAG: S8 family serine peptidase [Oscillospiraceae bacterium]|nr:S8 family serine peptidase [Oscillospiraceae bacterium]
MKTVLRRILAVTLAAALMLPGYAMAAQAPERDPGRVIVLKTGDGSFARNRMLSDFTWEPMADLTGVAQEDEIAGYSLGASDTATLMLVTSPTTSSTALAAALTARDDVLIAEPDRRIETDWLMLPGEGGVDGAYAEGYSDYSEYQWMLENSGDFASGNAGFDLDIPDDMTGADDVIIAVLDSGMDVTNPALSTRLVDLSEYPGLMEDSGCGQYGYNASLEMEDGADLTDVLGHGTHVAGIIGADNENGGVRGVMQQVKLLPVRVCEPTGEIWMSSILGGLAWMAMAKADYGVNIRAYNESMGTTIVSRLEQMLTTYCEQQDIVAVIATGNDATNIDGAEYTAAFAAARSSIRVNSIGPDGNPAGYTNFGMRETDVFAPGSTILSTAASCALSFNAFAAAKNARAGAGGSQALVYESFEPGDLDPAIGGLALHLFDETQDNGLGQALETTTDAALLGEGALEVSCPAETTVVSAPITLTDPGEPLYLGVSSFAQEDTYCKVYQSFRLTDGSWSKENGVLLNCTPSLWRASGGVAAKLPENVDLENFQIRLRFEVQIPGTVYLDCLGVGTGLEPFTVYSGTSMATPAVTGAFGLLCAAYPEETSVQIAARIKGGTVKTDALEPLCIAGGYLSVTKAAEAPDPAILSAQTAQTTVTLSGRFFGDAAGTLEADGAPLTVLQWQDDEIIAQRPTTPPEALSMVTVTAADGRAGRIVTDLTCGTDYTALPVPEDRDDGGLSDDNAYAFHLAALDGAVYCMREIEDPFTAANYNLLHRYEDGQWKTLGVVTDGERALYPGQLFAYDGALYACCYDAASSGGSIIVAYDPATNQWRKAAQSPLLKTGCTLVGYRGQLLAIGGQSADGTPLDTVYSVNLATGLMRKLPYTLPQPLTDVQACVSGDRLILCGGVDLAGEENPYITITDLSATETYDAPALGGAIAVPTADGIAVLGYLQTPTSGSATLFFDAASGAWKNANKRLSAYPAFSLAAAAAEDCAYVIGKIDSEDFYFFRSLEIAPAQQTYRATLLLPESANQTVTGMTFTVGGKEFTAFVSGARTLDASGAAEVWLPAGAATAQVQLSGGQRYTLTGKVRDGGENQLTQQAASGGSGGGGGGVTTYAVKLEAPEGGSVTISAATAAAGTKIRVTATPEDGKALRALLVKNVGGDAVAVTKNADGSYQFTMPSSSVTVSARFGSAMPEFADVPDDIWYASSVRSAYEAGLMRGKSDTRFDPNGLVTRAELFQILYNAQHPDAAPSEGVWYAAALAWAVETGISDGTNPTGVLTREQLSVMLLRDAQLTGKLTDGRATLETYRDASQVHPWAQDAMAWCVHAGIVAGVDGALLPMAAATRAQTAAMICRFFA